MAPLSRSAVMAAGSAGHSAGTWPALSRFSQRSKASCVSLAWPAFHQQTREVQAGGRGGPRGDRGQFAARQLGAFFQSLADFP